MGLSAPEERVRLWLGLGAGNTEDVQRGFA